MGQRAWILFRDKERKFIMAGKVTIGVLGERLDNLKEELFDKARGILPRLELKFDNHLKHHEKITAKKGDKVFKIFIVVLQAILSIGILYLLARKHNV